MDRARMEESTKRAEKQQIARAVVKIYPRLRAEANEEELLQLTAAAAPHLSLPLVRCLVETARLINRKIDDEYQWKIECPAQPSEWCTRTTVGASRQTGIVEATRMTRETGVRGATEIAPRYHLEELAAVGEEEHAGLDAPPPPPPLFPPPPPPPLPREISIKELRRRDLVRKKDR